MHILPLFKLVELSKATFNQSQQGITLFQNGQSYKFAYIRQDFNQADSQADEGHLKPQCRVWSLKC